MRFRHILEKIFVKIFAIFARKWEKLLLQKNKKNARSSLKYLLVFANI